MTPPPRADRRRGYAQGRSDCDALLEIFSHRLVAALQIQFGFHRRSPERCAGTELFWYCEGFSDRLDSEARRLRREGNDVLDEGGEGV